VAPAKFRRGFKAEADRIANEVRAELGLDFHARLDPHVLAAHLCVPVLSLVDLVSADPSAVRHFMHGEGRADFSAVTIYVGDVRRIVVYNPAHPEGRQANSLCHEIGHILLGHEAEGAISRTGSRDWNPEQEREADWLAGCLLIPREAANIAAQVGMDDAGVAAKFGVSKALASMRMNASGARLVVQRRRAYRTRRLMC
jgi:Zn-dependent peptidase ImmA (M78 family)